MDTVSARTSRVRKIVREVFGARAFGLIVSVYVPVLGMVVNIGRALDGLFFPSIKKPSSVWSRSI